MQCFFIKVSSRNFLNFKLFKTHKIFKKQNLNSSNTMTQLSVFLRHAKRSNNKQLDLSKRQLSFIPKQVYTIRAIEILNLSQNKIVSVQPAIADLYRLKVLNLEDNCIVELPEEVLSLPKITTLLLKGNPLDQRFQDLLIPKNQTLPDLIECLQKCFYSANKQTSNTPSWLRQHQSKQVMKIKTEQKNYQNEINWDQTVFKVDKTRGQSPQSRRLNKRQTSLKQSQPQNQSKNGILQLKLQNVQIFQQISMGGFSTIHRGQYQGLQVAVKKVFNPNVNQELLKQFNNQLSMLSKYRHPKIVLLIGAVTIPPTLCIVMEYVRDGTLYDLLHKRKVQLSDKQKRSIVLQLISVFSYLHNHGIVHRDIKSHNVLIQNLNIKICDFGLARHKSELNSGPMQFCGTPTYMAHELFMKKAYDQSVDIFALGTLFYEIYTSQVPYGGLDPSDIKQKVLKNSQLPSKIGIKKSIIEIINRCRHQDCRMRPAFKQLRDFNDW